MITNKVKNGVNNLKKSVQPLTDELYWARKDFVKPEFKKVMFRPTLIATTSIFKHELNIFKVFLQENYETFEERSSITFQDYVDNHRRDFIDSCSDDKLEACSDAIKTFHVLFSHVLLTGMSKNNPSHVVDNCNEFIDVLMGLNCYQIVMVENMFSQMDADWTMLNFFTNPNNVSEGGQPTAYAHFFQELTPNVRKETSLTMEHYIILNLNALSYNYAIGGVTCKTIPSQIANYHLGNRGDGFVESALFSEVNIYQCAEKFDDPCNAVNIFRELSKELESFNDNNGLNRRECCNQAYKKINVDLGIIDIIIDEAREVPLEWAINMHLVDLKDDAIKKYRELVNA